MLHPATLPIDELFQQCELKQTRRGGPGGQHRNKTESAVVVTHLPTGVIGQAGERRSQHENRAVAIERLRLNLALAIRTEIKPEQVASPLWQSRKRGRQISVNESHPDYPALLAEVLDFLRFDHYDVTTIAERLDVSASQIVKFLKQTPAAFQLLNQARQQLGLSKLK